MVSLGLEGKPAEAYELHYKMQRSIDLIFAEGNPAGIKALLDQKGSIKNHLRLPLVKATLGLQQQIEDFLKNFK